MKTKKRSKIRKTRKRKGGAFLGQGSYTCVVTPNVSCPGVASDSSNVSKLVKVSDQTYKLLPEYAIQQELTTNPAYAEFLNTTVVSLAVPNGICDAKDTTKTDLDGTPATPLPCNMVYQSMGADKRMIPGKYTNIVTRKITNPSARIAFETLPAVDNCFGIFYNAIRLLKTMNTQATQIVHSDLHSENMFYDRATNQVQIHDFGQGFILKKDEDIVKSILFNPLFGSIVRNPNKSFNTFFITRPGGRIEAAEISMYHWSMPFVLLNWLVTLFYKFSTPPSVFIGRPHNEVVDAMYRCITGGSRTPLQVYEHSDIPPVDFTKPFFVDVFEALKTTNPTQKFINLFKPPVSALPAGFDKSHFASVIDYILYLTDFLSICNVIRAEVKCGKSTLDKIDRMYQDEVMDPGDIIDNVLTNTRMNMPD